MWATAPETEGIACDVSHPVAQALCRFPQLRGLKPVDLSRALKVTPAQAQTGILVFAGTATGTRITFEGISADDAMALAGQAAGPRALRFDDAGGIVDTMIESARPYAAIIVVLLVIAVLFAESAADVSE